MKSSWWFSNHRDKHAMFVSRQNPDYSKIRKLWECLLYVVDQKRKWIVFITKLDNIVWYLCSMKNKKRIRNITIFRLEELWINDKNSDWWMKWIAFSICHLLIRSPEQNAFNFTEFLLWQMLIQTIFQALQIECSHFDKKQNNFSIPEIHNNWLFNFIISF